MDSLPQVRDYVRENIVFVPFNGQFRARRIQCLDDRRRNHQSELLYAPAGTRVEPPVAFFAGPLGPPALNFVVAQMLRARWKKEGDSRADEYHKILPFEDVMKFSKSYFGGEGFHTDDKHLDPDHVCEGCKHLSGLLDGEDDYGLGIYREPFRNYVTDLYKRAQAGDPDAYVFSYEGEHSGTAVVVLDSNPDAHDEYICLPPNDGKTSVFVLNDDMSTRLLEDYMHTLYREFEDRFDDLGLVEKGLIGRAIGAYYDHTRTTMGKLAKGKPVYEVLHTGKGKYDVVRSRWRF